LIVAGVMSGTSADGIDVALVNITGRGFNLRLKLLGHTHTGYPAPVRAAVLDAMNAERISVAELSRLNFLLGELYADAVRKAQTAVKIGKLDLVGCHGQTIYHQGEPARYLGKSIASTWQTGEGSVIAGRLGVPVVSDFRPAELAAGGKGAPLVPFLDYALFRHARRGRIVQNIGGIANLSAIPAGAKPESVMAFDTGPGNMLMDQFVQKFFSKAYDRNGAIAARGQVLEPVIARMLRAPYFQQKPPKTAGREEYGRQYAQAFLKLCGRAAKPDVIATATALTARSISQAITRFVLPRGQFHDYIVSGGGTQNRTLMRMLSDEMNTLGLKLTHTDIFGIPSQAKEAVAFAVLAYQTWHRRAGNIPSATGAKRAAILGKVSYS
jgi:anhydro-N-acetylmuramic acid kinase